MSELTRTDDLITFDGDESFSFTFTTNPFLDFSWKGDERSARGQ